jgi:membrane-bound metal-dependent hydrolase YbcI (DUF457 family)
LCTPIGHALAGLALYSFSNVSSKKRWVIFCIVLFFAVFPDIDFLFGFIVGDADKYHHQFTHSFLFVAIIGVVAALVIDNINIMNFKRSALLFISVGISHVFLDMLCIDTSAPFGVPIFWPFSEKYYISPILIFSDVDRVFNPGIFFQSLISWHNLKTILIEIIILGSIVVSILFIKYKRQRF